MYLARKVGDWLELAANILKECTAGNMAAPPGIPLGKLGELEAKIAAHDVSIAKADREIRALMDAGQRNSIISKLFHMQQLQKT